MSIRTKYILGVALPVITYIWSHYGNLRELRAGYAMDFICFNAIGTLTVASIWGSIIAKKIKLWMFAAAIILAIVPIGYVTHLLLFSKQFVIVYCVVVTSIIVIFRKELLQIKY